MSVVWADRVVTDDSLVQAVADIRRALDEAGARALRTVPRRGYLLASERPDAPPQEPADPERRTEPGSRGSRPVGSLGERLRAQASRRFVGREAELEALRPAVGRTLPPHALYFVHGPGGIGKSSLLERLKLSADPALEVVTLNGADLLPTPLGVIEGVGAALGLAERPKTAERLSEQWSVRGRAALMIDTFEALDAVEGWIRDTWLPSLPAQVSVVLAGRRAPDSRWNAHPLWAAMMQPVPVGMLEPEPCARLAEAHGAPAALSAALARRACGLPLAVVLLAADARRTGRLPDDLGEELVRALTRRCLDQSPSTDHREALLACALARRATRVLLVRLFGDDRANGLFEWIAAQGYVTASRDGLRLHDLMREAVLSDTSWCDRERFRQLRAEVVRVLASRLRPGRDAWDATLDFFHSRRFDSGFRKYHDVDGLSAVRTVVCTRSDLPDIVRFAARELPRSEHSAFVRWSEHPAAQVMAVRTLDGEVCGATLLLRTDGLRAADIVGDPVIARARTALGTRWREPTTETYSLFVRHWFAAGDTSVPRPPLTALMACMNPLFADDALRLYIAWLSIPAYLAQSFPELGFRFLPESAREVDGTRYEMLVRDWRAEPWAAWVRRVVVPERPGVKGQPGGLGSLTAQGGPAPSDERS